MQEEPWRYPEYLEQGANTVDDDDVQHVATNVESILTWMKRMRPLRRILDDLTLLVLLVRDYHRGIYRTIPRRVLLTIVFGISYVLSPVDAIPDPTPILGVVDDVALISILCCWANSDIQRYRRWRECNQEDEMP